MNVLARHILVGLRPPIILSSQLRNRVRLPTRPIEEALVAEAEAFKLLAGTDQVKLRLSNLKTEIRQKFFPNANEDAIVVAPGLVKKLMLETKASIKVVDSRTPVPFVELHPPKSHTSSSGSGNTRLGVHLAQGERGKSIRMRINIDDHMLGIRVKQADGFIQDDRVVTIVVKLPRARILITTPTSQKKNVEPETEEEKMNRMMYEVDTQRFVTAFSGIPNSTIRIMERPQRAEIVLILKRTSV